MKARNAFAGKTFRHGSAAGGNAVSLPPRAYGIDFVDRAAGDPATMHAAAARGTQGAGAPLPHLEKIQQSFGRHDVSGVSAHTGAAAAQASMAMGAQGFAYGDKVAFAGAPSLRLAAHEAAHAVQQRAGVHLKSGVGEPDDAYERQADAVAERVARGESAESLLDDAAAAPGAPAVQRSVGFEFELRADDWAIQDAKTRQPPEKGTPVIYGKDFQLQAEYSGANLAIAELVTNYPGVQTREQFAASVKDMQRLGAELDEVKAETSHSAREFKGGDPDFRMDKRKNDKIEGASLQVTAGVPLASVAALFRNLEGIVPAHERAVYQQARARADYVGGWFASYEFQGLMVLLQQYLGQLRAGGSKQPFVKGMIKVMARTDFHSMFALLPQADRDYIVNNMNAWLGYMLSGRTSYWGAATGFAPREHLVTPTISDPGSTDPAMQITTTREAWLRALPQRDLLTYKGRITPEGEPTQTGEVAMFPGRSVAQIEEDMLREGQTPRLKKEREAALTNRALGKPHGEPQTPEEQYGVTVDDRTHEEAMLEPIQNLYEGLGKLGAKTDLIKFQGQQNATAAPILEIRNPPPAGPVSNWFKVAESIYNAVDEAIQYPGGRGRFTRPKAYANELTDKQIEQRDEARAKAEALTRRLQSLEERVDEKED